MTESTAARKNLRDTLLEGLRGLPGTREFHIHVLQSSPRRNTSLYQFAKPRPRTYVQDVLVLLSEQSEGGEGMRVLVTAIEANLYHVPSTSSGILYVCKVDSTGQTSGVSPTRALVQTFLKYYMDPGTRPIGVRNLWVQLFARAQGQYLFPNSSMWKGKRPLSDVQLCAWWKRVLGETALEVIKSGTERVKGYYILPGFGQLEAEYCLKVVASDFVWTYGHSYGQEEGWRLPCPPEIAGVRNLGHYIPYFEDDPKSRFMDEIAYTTSGEVKSPVRKRARTGTSVEERGQGEGNEGEDGKGKEKEKEDRALGELGKVTVDEFWERMSFRQECVAGAVTGFFSVVVSREGGGGEDGGGGGGDSPANKGEGGQVSSQIHKRVMTVLTTGVEFSTLERATKATKTVESTIRGLCDGIRPTMRGGSDGTASTVRGGCDRRRPTRSRTPEPREERNSRAVPRTPPRHETSQVNLTPNPFPEPVPSLETYELHIYGSVSVKNADGSGEKRHREKTEQVRVLNVRKKKKAVD